MKTLELLSLELDDSELVDKFGWCFLLMAFLVTLTCLGSSISVSVSSSVSVAVSPSVAAGVDNISASGIAASGMAVLRSAGVLEPEGWAEADRDLGIKGVRLAIAFGCPYMRSMSVTKQRQSMIHYRALVNINKKAHEGSQRRRGMQTEQHVLQG